MTISMGLIHRRTEATAQHAVLFILLCYIHYQLLEDGIEMCAEFTI